MQQSIKLAATFYPGLRWKKIVWRCKNFDKNGPCLIALMSRTVLTDKAVVTSLRIYFNPVYTSVTITPHWEDSKH